LRELAAVRICAYGPTPPTRKDAGVARRPAVILINPFEVPPEADDALVAEWDRARAFLAARAAFRETTLHRALRADIPLRFVNIALIDAPATWRDAVGDPDFPGAAMPFAAHPALYEVEREDGEPDGAGGVLLIQPFEVPDGEDERFLAGWEGVRERFALRQGYLGTRLHRSLGPADFRFVAVVRWSSPLMVARTLQQPEAERAIASMPFPGQPALYLPHAGGP